MRIRNLLFAMLLCAAPAFGDAFTMAVDTDPNPVLLQNNGAVVGWNVEITATNTSSHKLVFDGFRGGGGQITGDHDDGLMFHCEWDNCGVLTPGAACQFNLVFATPYTGWGLSTGWDLDSDSALNEFGIDAQFIDADMARKSTFVHGDANFYATVQDGPAMAGTPERPSLILHCAGVPVAFLVVSKRRQSQQARVEA